MPKPIIPGRPSPQRIKELQQIAKLREYTRPKSHEEIIEEHRKQERMKRIIEIIRRKYKNTNLPYIPRYLPEAEIKTFLERGDPYNRMRGIEEYNLELEKDPELKGISPTLQKIIRSFRKSKIRVLDLGAGEGNLELDLNEKYPNIKPKTKQRRKKVEYEGVDILPSLNPKVRTFDFTYERLPKNTYDLIISMWSLDYVGDKLKAIQNCCDALQVGGKFVIVTTTDKIELKKVIEENNPHLRVDINSTNGIIITKKENKPTVFQLRLKSVRPFNRTAHYLKYHPVAEFGLNHKTSALKSEYEKK